MKTEKFYSVTEYARWLEQIYKPRGSFEHKAYLCHMRYGLTSKECRGYVKALLKNDIL